MPQPFTFRTAELSQFLRISRKRLTEAMQNHKEDHNILMNNLLQKLNLKETLPEVNQPDQRFLSKYDLFHIPREEPMLPRSHLHYTEQKSIGFSNKVPIFGDGTDSTKLLGEESQEENIHNKSNCKNTISDGMMDKQEDLNEVHISCETKTSAEEFCIKINSEDNRAASGGQTMHAIMEPGSPSRASENIARSRYQDYSCKKVEDKRVTIHIYPHTAIGSTVQNGKLISLPGSLEELIKIGRQMFPGFHSTKVVSRDYVEIDDIGVIRDGDHIFFIQI